MLCRRCAPVPQGHLIAAHHGSGKRRKRWLPPVGTIEPSVLGSHTATPAQAANRSSLALAGWVAFEKKRPTPLYLATFIGPAPVHVDTRHRLKGLTQPQSLFFQD